MASSNVLQKPKFNPFSCASSNGSEFVDCELHRRVRKGSIDKVKDLLTRYDHKKKKTRKVLQPGEEGQTPLHIAINRGSLPMVKVLVDNGADVNVADEQQATPFHYALRGGNLLVIKMLLVNGADVNLQDGNGVTPLHQAARDIDNEVVTALLRAGADPNCGLNRRVGLQQLASRSTNRLRSVKNTVLVDSLLFISESRDEVRDVADYLYNVPMKLLEIWDMLVVAGGANLDIPVTLPYTCVKVGLDHYMECAYGFTLEEFTQQIQSRSPITLRIYHTKNEWLTLRDVIKCKTKNQISTKEKGKCSTQEKLSIETLENSDEVCVSEDSDDDEDDIIKEPKSGVPGSVVTCGVDSKLTNSEMNLLDSDWRN